MSRKKENIEKKFKFSAYKNTPNVIRTRIYFFINIIVMYIKTYNTEEYVQKVVSKYLSLSL